MNNKKSQSYVGRAVKNYFSQNWGILLGLAILCVIFSIFGNNFLTQKNILNLLRTCATNCFLAIGVQMAIILAGIDLTGGALAALSGVMTVAAFQWWGFPVQLAVLMGILIGVVIGLLNGVIVAYTGIHPFVVTLAMQSFCRGTAYLVANGSPVTAYGNDGFAKIGQGSLGPVPLPVVYMIIFLILDYFFLNKTQTGRHIYAVGGNEVSARFSGINVKKIKILVWTISGALAGFCGVVLASRLASGQPSTGEGYETDAIAAAVLGGTSFFGTGSVGGLLIGVLIIGLISNGLNLMHVNSYWQFVLKGIIIIAAVYVDMVKQKKQNAAK